LRHRLTSPRPLAWIVTLVVACLLPCAGGCTALGVIAGKTMADNNPAEYKIKKVTTLVLVESFRDPSSVALDAATIEQYVIEDIRQNNAAPMADRTPLEDLRASHPDEFHRMTIRELGEMVGAKQVIYVNLIDTTVDQTPGSEMWRGQGRALVRIIDTADGRTLWPNESTKGYSVEATTPLINEDQSQTLTELDLRSTLQHLLSDRIAQLFYATQQEDTQDASQDDVLNK
jgi:hypothetical protein